MKTVGINKFVKRQCDAGFEGTRIQEEHLSMIKYEVEDHLYADKNVFPGYAPFCKVVVIENIFDVEASYLHADDIGDAKPLPRSFSSRREGEPAMPDTPAVEMSSLPQAKFLHCIVYTKEQLASEGEEHTGADFDLICINAEMGMEGAPMTPSTILRNAMGSDFGGSGHTASVEEYSQSVEFWSQHHKVVKAG